MSTKIIQNKVVGAVVLVTLGILFRMVWHLGDNIEFVTTAALLAGYYFGVRWGIGVPLAIMAVTDFLLGNTSIFLFTWSGYVFIGCLSTLGHLNDLKRWPKILHVTGLGILASAFFFLWTNFGVWYLDNWGMYPKTIAGLMQSYVYGIPFFKANLLGNLFFVPVSFSLFDFILHKRWNFFRVKNKKAFL